ncbi:MAG: class I SAM-dependent methyltransferase [Candidatus Bathyarchaeia archaeon]
MSNKKIFFKNCVFLVWENVYEPAEDTFLFAENLEVKKGALVLEMGTGCGILGILAAKKAFNVVAVDINPHAVRCAKENAKLNKVSNKMHFVCGDLFTPLKADEKFDLILFNPPYLPSEPDENESWLVLAWSGGTTGRQTVERFIDEAPNYLKSGGAILLLQSTLSNIDETIRKFEEKGLKTNILAERDLPFFEKIALIKAQAC